MTENKTMMKLVVGTEAMFFVALIMSFVYMAYNAGFEPHEVKALDIKTTGFFTLFLLSSSGTLWLAERKQKQQKLLAAKNWLILTILFGIIFLVGQGKEYWRLIHEHISVGSSVFGSSFYALTGFHGLHVFIGLIMLFVVLLLSLLGDYDDPYSSRISIVAIYWHFVDIVWLAVFTIVYILPYYTKI